MMGNDQTLTLRPVADNDRAFLKDLSKACYHDVIVDFYGEWNEALFEKNFEAEWAKKKFQVVEKDDDRIGALWVDDRADHLFISEIQIHPDWQGQGFGTVLMAQVLAEAATRNLPVRLQVFKNSKARLFYEWLGFERTGQTDTHYTMQMDPLMKDLP